MKKRILLAFTLCLFLILTFGQVMFSATISCTPPMYADDNLNYITAFKGVLNSFDTDRYYRCRIYNVSDQVDLFDGTYTAGVPDFYIGSTYASSCPIPIDANNLPTADYIQWVYGKNSDGLTSGKLRTRHSSDGFSSTYATSLTINWSNLSSAQLYTISGSLSSGGGYDLTQHYTVLAFDALSNLIHATMSMKTSGNYTLIYPKSGTGSSITKIEVHTMTDTYVCDKTGTWTGQNYTGETITLPVILSTFTAQYLNNIPTLYWVTQSETDNIGWYVYRNTQNDFITSMIISDLIPGYGTTSEPHSYIYEDHIENVFPGDTYWYWLESIDFGGMINHYDEVAHIVIPENYDPGNENPEEFEEFGLFQSNPNPFNPKTEEATEISFNLKEQAYVEINIYNIKGELIKTIYDGFNTADEAVWDGKDESGKLQSTGMYLCSLIVNDKLYQTKRLILLR